MSQDVTYLPSTGIISVKALAKYLGTSDATLIQGLSKHGVPYIKLSKFHEHWLIRLEDLKANDKIPSGGVL